MPFSPTSSDRLLSIYLTLSQYPILSSRIRARMRLELFQRGLIQPAEFEAQVRQTAIQSQHQEGLDDPFAEEPLEIWEIRISHVRDQLTDVIFGQNFEFAFFENIVNEVLGERGTLGQPDVALTQPGNGANGPGVRAGHDHRAHVTDPACPV